MSLTAARTDDELAEVLCADALVLAREDLVPPHARVVDVGSGAGAPAVPLAILREDLTFVLVEPLRKRVAFLRTAIGTLDLASRVRVLETRAERGSEVPGGPFDVATSRATLAPGEWLALGAALAERVVVFTAREEPPPVPDDWISSNVVYSLPSSGAPRRITVYRLL
jgi:16S rRNA (guanine527-N7)-methyltransferase